MKNVDFIFRTILVCAMLLLVFTGCKEEETIVGSKPVADAGADLETTTGTAVTLDGSGSSDAEGDPLTYAWEIVSPSDISGTTIDEASAEVTSFTAEVAGVYTIKLTVNDGNNAAVSDEAIITVVESTVETVIIDANISSDTEWENIFTDDRPDYRVTRSVAIGDGATLTIAPGVIVAFESDAGLTVNGALIADGLADDGILFTGTTKQKGFWKGIAVFSSNVNNLLNNVTVEYGGSSAVGSGIPEVNVGVENGDRLKITNSVIKEGLGYGLFFESGAIIEEFSNNQFENNDLFPLGLDINNVDALDRASIFTGNGNNQVAIFNSTLDQNGEIEWKSFSDNTSYRVQGNLSIRSGLLISEGTSILFASDVGIDVTGADGYLIVKGTESDKVIFSGVTESAGSWKGIAFFTNNIKNELDHAVVSYGGSSAFGSGIPAVNVGVENGDRLKITNSEIFGSGDYGVFFELGSTLSEFENNDMHDNTGFPISLSMANATKIDQNSTFNVGNGDNSVNILGNTLDEGSTEISLSELSNGTSYYLSGDLSIRSGLVIEDGVKIEVASDELIDVSSTGYLIADGTAGKGISITGKTKSPGAWKGLAIFTNDVRNLLDYVTVSHGGSSAVGSGIPQVNIGVENGDRLTVTNCTITDCNGTGLFGESGSTLTQSGNTFINNIIDLDIN